MTDDLHPPEIFDRRRRRALRARAARRTRESFLWDYIAEDLAERLAVVTRTFENVLIIGPIGYWQHKLLPSTTAAVLHAPLSDAEAYGYEARTIEEDRLPYEPGSFDLVISAGTLDSVNDLPGALIQIRHVLKPDGLFLGHMFGVGTLSTLKSTWLAAERDMAAPHIHPQIDLRSAADLLARAGFALPVADQDMMTARYANWRRIVSDIRDAGLGNALAGPRKYPGKDFIRQLDNGWTARADKHGKVEEYFTHLHMSGWAPSAQQPRPARRGSGQVSLSDILPFPIKR
jgi:NADH dehydrogenase [ubiquinone] 1 alpha subcomplex assembly factor 5